jgi:Fe-S-cluster containining protein
MITKTTTLPGEGLKGREICALCAEYGCSCCATDPALGYLGFPLSLAEWRRLNAYVHLATESDAEPDAADLCRASSPLADEAAPPEEGDAICQPWPNHKDFLTSMLTLFPREKARIREMFPPKGGHLSLRLRANGACVFLGNQGCRLPRASRPWYCLLFPAWVMDNSLTMFTPEECFIARRARNPMQGVELMDVEARTLKDIYWNLRLDWGIGPG